MRRVVLAAVGGVLVLSGCGVESSSGPSSSATQGQQPAASQSAAEAPAADPAADVVVNTCDKDQFGMITAKLTITNSQAEPMTYAVTASANTPDGSRVAELNTFANSIQPGQAATVDAMGMAQDAPDGLTCVVVSVDRFPG